MNKNLVIFFGISLLLTTALAAVHEKERPVLKRSARQTGRSVTSNSLCYCDGGLKQDCAGDTVCTADCNGDFRDSHEVDCIFPFNVDGVWYDTCTDVGMQTGNYWCSIDKYFTGRYALCEEKCPMLARNLVANTANTHSACLEKDPNYVGIEPNDEEIELILKTHNDIRSKITDAEDLRVVTWDHALSRLALNLAEHGPGSHDCGSCRRLLNNRTISLGQNLFGSSGISYTIDFWPMAIGAWESEVKDFEYGTGSTTGNWADVGHYTQIINSAVGKVGCAAAKSGSTIKAVCNYAGIQYGVDKPYTSGDTCAKCGPGNCVNNLCGCTKYCQNFGTLDPVTCTCTCEKWAYGDECEFKMCNKTDADYGCWGDDKMYCVYSNTIGQCPHMCGSCDFIPAN